MLGDQKGRITSQRVLDVGGGMPKLEDSFSMTGKFRGVEATDIGTYWSSPKPGGTIYGEAQGV